MATAQHDWSLIPPREEDRLIARLRDIRGAASVPSVAEIVGMLETAMSFRLRNAAALALADLGATAARDCIGAVLARPEVAPQSGTLLFVLNELGGRLPLDSFVNILRNGSCEGRSEAFGLFDAGRVTVTDSESRRRAVEDLSALASDHDPEVAEAAREILDALTTPGGRLGILEHTR